MEAKPKRTALKPGLRTYPPSEPITMLRIVGTDTELKLSPVKHEFMLGSAGAPTCSVTVRSGQAKETVSSRHVALIRDGRWLEVIDQHSTNGTYLDDQRETKFKIKAGDAFRVADVELLALDEHLGVLRDDLRWSLGYQEHLSVDNALRALAKGSHVVLAGPSGCDQPVLARRIHATSPRREKPFVEIDQDLLASTDLPRVLAGAQYGTAFLQLQPPPRDRKRGRTSSIAAVRRLLSDEYRIRLIVAATRTDDAYARMPGLEVTQDAVIQIPALSTRAGDVYKLLDYMFAELPSERRIGELPEYAIEGLASYPWPGNIDELRSCVDRLHAVVVGRGHLRPAARAISMPAGTMIGFCAKYGVRAVADD